MLKELIKTGRHKPVCGCNLLLERFSNNQLLVSGILVHGSSCMVWIKTHLHTIRKHLCIPHSLSVQACTAVTCFHYYDTAKYTFYRHCATFWSDWQCHLAVRDLVTTSRMWYISTVLIYSVVIPRTNGLTLTNYGAARKHHKCRARG